MTRLNARLIGRPAVEGVERLAVRRVDARPAERGCTGVSGLSITLGELSVKKSRNWYQIGHEM